MAYADGEYPFEIVYNEHSEAYFEALERDGRRLGGGRVNFYLIRHAHALQQTMTEYFWGRSYEMPLTPEGREQALRLKDRLEELGLVFSKVLCSPAVRTIETLEIALPAYPRDKIIFDDHLAEQGRGLWAGKRRKDVLTPDIERRIREDMWNFKIAGMESAEDTAVRMERALEGHARGYKGNIAVFTHSGAIRNFLTRVMNLDKRKFAEIPIENTSITHLEYENGVWTLHGINDYSHLEEVKQNARLCCST